MQRFTSTVLFQMHTKVRATVQWTGLGCGLGLGLKTVLYAYILVNVHVAISHLK